MTLIISLIAAAIILLTAEIFLPGMIAGILGSLCLVGSVIATTYQYGVNAGFMLLMAELLACAILFMCWMKFFPSSPLGKKFSLNKQEVQTSAPVELNNLLGKYGTTLNALRPAGNINIDGKRYDAVSEGSHISANRNIKVVKVEGARIVVRQL